MKIQERGRVKEPNQECTATLREKENYQSLGILEADNIKHAVMMEK